LWWEFEFQSEAPRSLRALLGVVILSSAVAVWSLVRPAIGRVESPTPETLAKAAAIVEAQDEADGNLVRMGDKSLLFSEDERAFIMYGRKNRSMIALFDPIGPRDAWPELVWRFIEMARGAGCRAVFYQVSPDALSLYADAGMQAFRLGELATIDLARFDLVGGKRAALRQTKARGARDGLTFEVIAQGDVAAALPDLTAVSDAWLTRHEANEKAFSLGAFEDGYVSSQPVAVLRLAGRIVAFANLLVTQTKAEGSIDLMRFHPDAPSGAMDVLFVHLLEYLKAEGYGRFNMGMAPLSGMSGRKIAPIWDRVGTTVFEHGERFYNFKGLRAFKSKFHPHWRARYMTTAGGLSPALALVDVTLLIGGGLKGVAQR
ncbi:MAG: bifunctional lysylphosphatidylglycerol flippase/synthetase MprF, partial [Sphingomonadales bacterium]